MHIIMGTMLWVGDQHMLIAAWHLVVPIILCRQ